MHRRIWLPAILAIVVIAIYIWQIGVIWRTQLIEGDEGQATRTTSGMIAWRQPQLLDIKGMGIGAGASATLRYNGYDPIAMLQVSDLPALPPGRAYQVWCYDTQGLADPATVFQIPVDSDETKLVMVSAPRLFNSYNHFAITVESIKGSASPTGEIVMSN